MQRALRVKHAVYNKNMYKKPFYLGFLVAQNIYST